MTEKPKPADTPAQGDDRNLVDVTQDATAAANFDERLFLFWRKYQRAIYVAIGVLLGLVIGRWGWDAFRDSREQSIREEFRAAGTIEAKRRFAAEHPDHPLGGVALLESADQAYKDGNYAQSIRDYEQALAALPDPALKGRARTGAAMAAILGGVESKGEPALRAIAADASLPEPVRAEAWYHVAALASSQKEYAKVQEALEKLEVVDPNGVWARRGMILRAEIPADFTTAPVAPPAEAAPAATPPPATP